MRFVRFITMLGEDIPASWVQPRWGVLSGDEVYPIDQPPYQQRAYNGSPAAQVTGGAYALDAVRLVAPATPTKLVCVGRNYAEHAAELGNEVPTEPLIFLKPPTTIIGPDEKVVYPGISERVDHEGELALVIGRRCRNLSEANAMDVIFGYTLANDVTARDLQRSDNQWTRGKGFDTFAPTGPWIDTAFDPANKVIRCYVNDELRQESNTDLMIYTIPTVLTFVTRFMTLEPGDLVLTGTPAGVGPVQPGDVMRVEMEGLGSLSNEVIAEV